MKIGTAPPLLVKRYRPRGSPANHKDVATSGEPLFLAPRHPHHVVARRDHFVGLKHDLATGRLGSLFASVEVHLVKAQDLDELDRVEFVHDREQLALMQRSPRRPACAGAAWASADDRVEIRVQRVADPSLDSLDVRPRRHLEVDHYRYGAKSHRLKPHRGAEELTGVEVPLDLLQQAGG